jgi:hypothetical protein
MRIHASQLNLNADLYAANAVARAEAKASAELTRKKLLSFASALAGEVDDPEDCVVKLRGYDEPRDESGRQERPYQQEAQGGGDEPAEKEETELPEVEVNPFSGWA